MRTPELIIAPSFVDQLSALQQDLPHATILAGEHGAGLMRLARHVSGTHPLIITSTESTKTTNGSIGIDLIRTLYTETRGNSKAKQTVIIDDADRMSEPAQNAFLKLLEEPGRNVHFILTTHHPERLLPTVRSRARIVRVPRITATQSRELLEKYKLDAETTTQLLFVACGRPAELVRLAMNPRLRDELIQTMRDARILLGNDRYAAYHTALQYGDSLSRAEKLVTATKRLFEHSIKQSPSHHSVTRLARLIAMHDRLQRGANPRLQLAQFVIQYL